MEGDMGKIVNQSWLTALRRGCMSAPARYLMCEGLLVGRILDFGCGYGYDVNALTKLGYDIVGYDKYHRVGYPSGVFDVVMCNYVLNVVSKGEGKGVEGEIEGLLVGGGVAYYAVRSDVKGGGYRWSPVYRGWTYQRDVRMALEEIHRGRRYRMYRYVKGCQ